MKPQWDRGMWEIKVGSVNRPLLRNSGFNDPLFQEYFSTLAEILEEWEKVKRKIREY